MIEYQMITEHIHQKELGSYTSYGICAVTNNQEIVAKISDMSLDKNQICTLVNLCNRLQLDVIHLQDVVDDAI